MNIIDLERFLRSEVIPEVRKKTVTFLSVSKQPHYENVWSNIYAFFFNLKAEHGLKNLFLKSLNDLLNADYFLDKNFKIETEYTTSKGGRIDILLFNVEEAIIIENKVYHVLNNDLQDYLDSVNSANKQGVILSLTKILNTKNKHFLNITHLELMECVMKNLHLYISNANEKWLIFLKDFYQNIINMTNPIAPEIVNFYCKNAQQIREIEKVRDTYVNYIKSEIEKACSIIDEKLDLIKNRDNDREKRLRYYQSPKNKNLMFTILFDGLLKSKKELVVIVELKNDFIQNKKIKNIEFDDKEQNLLSKNYDKTNRSWVHFATEKNILTEENILHLSQYLSKKINESPLLRIYRKLNSL